MFENNWFTGYINQLGPPFRVSQTIVRHVGSLGVDHIVFSFCGWVVGLKGLLSHLVPGAVPGAIGVYHGIHQSMVVTNNPIIPITSHNNNPICPSLPGTARV